MNAACRIRLKLPDGSELEAEGDPDFVRSERERFLASKQPGGAQEPIKQEMPASRPAPEEKQAPGAAGGTAGSHYSPLWNTIIEPKGEGIQLRAKLDQDKTGADACLVLLNAAQKILNVSKPTAAQIAKWLRASGYPIQRVDRAVSEALGRGDLLASGSRRARRYELTGPGRVKALHLANQLAERFQ